LRNKARKQIRSDLMGNSADMETRGTSGSSFVRHLNVTLQVLLLLLLVCTPIVVWELTGIPKPAMKQAFGELITCFILVLWLMKMNETGRWKVQVSALTVAVAILLVVQVLSIIVAVNRGYALRCVRQITFPALLYFVAMNNVKGERRIRGCLIAVTVSAVVVSVYGLIQSAGMDFMGWCEDPQACILAPSSFHSAAAAASFLVIAFPISVALVLYSRSFTGKLVAAAVAVLILLHLRLTARAEAFAALEIALAATFVVVWLVRRDRAKRGTVGARQLASAFGILVVLLGAAHALTVLRNDSTALSDVQPTLHEQRLLRKAAWGCAARMTVDHPVLGTGIGSYQLESPLFWNDTLQRWFARSPEAEVAVQNEYLTVAAESGVAGLAASVLVVSLSCAYFLAACRRTASDRALYLAVGIGFGVVAAAVNAFFSSSFHEPTVLFHYFFLLAMVDVMAHGDAGEGTGAADKAYRKRRAVYYPVWAVLVPATLLVPFFAARPLAYHQHMKTGRDKSLQERFEDARREFGSACQIFPWAWEPAVQRARNAAVQGETAHAAWGYMTAGLLHPNHLVVLVNGGQAFLASDKPEAAIRRLEKTVRLTPYLSTARYALGEAYAAVENWGAALENFDAAEQQGFSNLAGLLLNQCTCLYRLGRHSPADERLEELLRLEPEDPLVWYGIGRLEFERGRTSAALEAFNKALSLSERDRPEPGVLAGIHCQLARLYLEELNDVVAASRHAALAAEIDADDDRVLELVKTLVELTRSDEVRAASAPVLSQVLYNVGASLSRVREDPEPLLEEAAALAGDLLPTVVRDANVRLAEHKLKLNRYGAARAHLDAAELVDPLDYNVFRVRGDVYTAMEMYPGAREAYLQALHIRPADAQSRAALLRIEGLVEAR